MVSFPTSPVTRSLIGSGLKSIGVFSRVGDIPENQPALKRKTLLREGAVLTLSFMLGMAFEGLMSAGLSRFGLRGKISSHPVAEFLPQAAAIYLSEVASRKLTNYKGALHGALDGNTVSVSPAGDSFEKFMSPGFRAEKMNRPSVGTTELTFAAQPRQTQFSTMRGFY